MGLDGIDGESEDGDVGQARAESVPGATAVGALEHAATVAIAAGTQVTVAELARNLERSWGPRIDGQRGNGTGIAAVVVPVSPVQSQVPPPG